MERLPNRYPKISQSHKVPLYKGLSLFYPKLLKYFVWQMISASLLMQWWQNIRYSLLEKESIIEIPRCQRQKSC